MNPRPTAASVPDTYPKSYYTHTATPDPAQAHTRLRGRVRERLARRLFGYPVAPDDDPGSAAGLTTALTALVPRYRMLAGYQVRFCEYVKDGLLLDVGCGNGEQMAYMRSVGWQVLGFDPDSAAIDVAKSRGLNASVATAETYAVEPGKYDAITMTHVLEHLSDPHAVLARLFSGLKPGGAMVVLTPNPAGVYARWYTRTWVDLDPPRHLVLPSPDGFKAMARRITPDHRVFTLTRTGRAIIQQSRNARAGGAGKLYCSDGRVHSRFLAAWARTIETVTRGNGNEVVCILKKPR